MEPLSTFAVVIDVFQLVGILRTIFSTIHQIYENGAVDDNITIEDTASDLEKASPSLTKKLESTQASEQHDIELKVLSHKSAALADQVIKDLHTHTSSGKGRVFKSVLYGTIAIFKKGSVSEKLEELDRYQHAIHLRLSASIRSIVDDQAVKMGRTAADVEDIHLMLGQVMTEMASIKANTAAMPQVTADLEIFVKTGSEELARKAEENTLKIMLQADTNAQKLSKQSEDYHQQLIREISAQAEAGASHHHELMENIRQTSYGLNELTFST